MIALVWCLIRTLFVHLPYHALDLFEIDGVVGSCYSLIIELQVLGPFFAQPQSDSLMHAISIDSSSNCRASENVMNRSLSAAKFASSLVAFVHTVLFRDHINGQLKIGFMYAVLRHT